MHGLLCAWIMCAHIMWIESFLTERKQRVVINGESSPWLEVTSGIPPGVGARATLLFDLHK